MRLSLCICLALIKLAIPFEIIIIAGKIIHHMNQRRDKTDIKAMSKNAIPTKSFLKAYS
jgi:hypothetical protein